MVKVANVLYFLVIKWISYKKDERKNVFTSNSKINFILIIEQGNLYLKIEI